MRVVNAIASPAVSSRDRLPSLTGLRFWAALLVVLYHLDAKFGDIALISDLVMFGRTGVTFFFVLSGYVLTWTYLDRFVGVKVFLWRRFVRLWPALAVSNVIVLVLAAKVETFPSPSHMVAMFTFLQAWRLEWAIGANGAWSLSNEAFFYLVFPLLLLLAGRRTGRRALWVGVSASIVGLWLWFVLDSWPTWWLDYLPLSRFIQFALGVACAIAMKRGMRAPTSLTTAAALVLAYHCGLRMWSLVLDDPLAHNGPRTGSQWWAAPTFALLVMAAAQADLDGVRTSFARRWCVTLGHWSYSWYLLHGLVIIVWSAVLPPSGEPLRILGAWLGVGTVSLACSAALYLLVERPIEARYRGLIQAKQGQASMPDQPMGQTLSS